MLSKPRLFTPEQISCAIAAQLSVCGYKTASAILFFVVPVASSLSMKAVYVNSRFGLRTPSNASQHFS